MDSEAEAEETSVGGEEGEGSLVETLQVEEQDEIIWTLDVEDVPSDAVLLQVEPHKTVEADGLVERRKGGPKKCHLCSFVVTGGGSLKKHMRDQHDFGEQSQCSMCSKYVLTRVLVQHMEQVHEDGPGQCDTCSAQTDLLRAHIRQLHADVFKLCSKCLVDVPADLYDDHVLENHQHKFNCELCNKEFYNHACYRHHIKLTHLRSKIYQCAWCDFSTAYQGSMDKHMTGAHYRNERYECKVCHKTFGVRDNWLKHLRITHEGVGKVECPICQKVVYAKRELTNHMRLHTGDLPFQCDFCNRRFPKKWTLKSHRRIHTGEKLFQCSVCDETFRTANQMKIHGFREHGIEEYRCADRSSFARKHAKTDTKKSSKAH